MKKWNIEITGEERAVQDLFAELQPILRKRNTRVTISHYDNALSPKGISSLEKVIDYLYEDEERHFGEWYGEDVHLPTEQWTDEQKNHIFYHFRQLKDDLDRMKESMTFGQE